VGMDRVTSIMRLDRKRLYIIYPGLKSYADMVIPDESAQSLAKNLKVDKKALGKEPVGTHPCTKSLLTITDEKGRKEMITSWEATDMKGFPVQAQMVENGQSILVKFRNVKLNRPDAKLFEPPTGYKKYDDIQKLMTQGMGGK
jgi:outer membrane lipoprotein-sorting protein